MAKIKVKGKVVYQNLGTGFWGVEDQSGKQWRPVNMPEQIKYQGKEVELVVREVEEGMSIFMWGTPVKVISFSTLKP